jgi:hypothetical protein
MKNSVLLLPLALSALVACASKDKPTSAAKTALVDQSAAIASNPGDVSLGGNWTMRPAQRSELQRTVPSVTLARDEKNAELVFVSYEPKELKADEEDQYVFRPAIVLKKSKVDATQFVVFDAFARYDWVGGAALPEKGLYWGLLEYQVEGTAHSLPLLSSKDGGQSWTVQAFVPKARFTDVFRSFGMDENGKGYVALEKTDSEGSFYIVETADGGRHWSEPRFYRDMTASNKLLSPECAFSMTPVKKVRAKCGLPERLLK